MKNQNILIVHPENENELTVIKAFFDALKIKFEETKEVESPYNSEFVAKIKKSKQDYIDGNFVTIEKKDLSNFLGLE
jgi:hypothetical protein